MVYLNNAATTYTKPQCVLDAHAAALCALPTGQFRSSSAGEEDIFDQCRKSLGILLQIKQWERIFFASGATDAMNALVCGLDLKGKQIITTATEHNCVLRSLYNQEVIKSDSLFPEPVFENGYPVSAKASKVVVLPCDENGYVAPEALEAVITPYTGAIIINHCSNVTGMVQDMEAFGKITKEKEILLIADVSQSAGCLSVKTNEWGIDALVFTGHKSLYGLQGTGGYYVREGIPLIPYRYGGTGRNSVQLTYENGDYEYEPGTQNAPGIAALHAGVEYILTRGVSVIRDTERQIMKMLYDGLAKLPSVSVYGSFEKNEGPVLSFTIKGLPSSDVAYILQNGYGIVVRAGVHCAPLIHHFMHTKKNGTVRVSLSGFTTEDDIKAFLIAMKDLDKSACVS